MKTKDKVSQNLSCFLFILQKEFSTFGTKFGSINTYHLSGLGALNFTIYITQKALIEAIFLISSYAFSAY